MPRTRCFRLLPLPLALLTCLPVTAQEVPDVELAPVEVRANVQIYRNRLNTVPPVLSYDLSYFQRFEPLTVGDMLKRVPGVSFSSDVLEYDAVQFRGVGAEYTQILINGHRVPGGGSDRSVQVDRIPAELVARIEVIRSPNATVSSQGMAGTINIVLKKGAQLRQGTWRLAGQQFDDGEITGLGFASVAGQMDKLSYFLGVNVQQRYNPKRKIEFHSTPDRVLGYNELEQDTRDGVDTGFNGSLIWGLGDGKELSLRAYYLATNRDEDEEVQAIAVNPVAVAELEESEVVAGQLLERGIQHEEISQQTATLGVGYRAYVSEDTEMSWDLGIATFQEDTKVNEDEFAYVDEEVAEDPQDADLDEIEQVVERLDVEDRTIRLAVDFTTLRGSQLWRYGVLASDKQRQFELLVFERDYDAGDMPPAFETSEDQVGDGRFELDQQRLDLYVDDVITLSDRATLELGVRAEYTQHEGAKSGESNSSLQINPSAHFRYVLSQSDQLRISLARTLRRPDFDELIPYRDVNEDFVEIGNPEVEPETAVGVDVGWEHRIAGAAGIFGVNVFYRDIADKIEEVQVGEAIGSDDEEVPLVQVQNLGDARFYGIEFDSSLPLTAFGLPKFGVFGNVTILRSELTDPVTGESRRFNNQPELIYNLGFNHDLSGGWAYGMSYQKRGESLEVLQGERVNLRYEGNLEAFVEKDFDNGLTLRLAGNNLLDAEKREDILNLDDGEIEKREVQLETAGSVVTLTLRGRF